MVQVHVATIVQVQLQATGASAQLSSQAITVKSTDAPANPNEFEPHRHLFQLVVIIYKKSVQQLHLHYC